MASNLVTNLQATPYPIESITKMGQWEDFYLQVGRNQIMGHQTVNIFGYSAGIGNVNQAVWEGATTSGNDYVFPSSAAQLSIVSTSTSDGSSLNLQVNGLDSNFNILTEVIALNGTTAVTTVNSYYRVNSLYVLNGTNVGTIKATQGGSTVYAQINPGVGETQMAVYTVPNGYVFYKYRIDLTTSITSGSYVTFKQNTLYNLAATTTRNGYTYTHQGNTIIVDQTALNGNNQIDWVVPFGLPAGSDNKWQMQTSSGGSNGAGSCAIYGILVQTNGQALASAL